MDRKLRKALEMIGTSARDLVELAEKKEQATENTAIESIGILVENATGMMLLMPDEPKEKMSLEIEVWWERKRFPKVRSMRRSRKKHTDESRRRRRKGAKKKQMNAHSFVSGTPAGPVLSVNSHANEHNREYDGSEQRNERSRTW
jgi:hypothetical protein